MTVGVRTDPDVRPRRRNRQRFDAGEFVLVLQGFVVLIEVAESRAAALAPKTGSLVRHITKAARFRGLRGVDNDFVAIRSSHPCKTSVTRVEERPDLYKTPFKTAIFLRLFFERDFRASDEETRRE